MAPLKSLEKEYPVIDSNFQSFCARHGIFTVQDFLLHDLYVLAAFAQQHPSSSSDHLKQGITQMLSIVDEQYHKPWVNGVQLLDDFQRNKHVLSTGIHEIDSLLQGGFREGQLNEIAGPSSSGKTQVCLQVAASVATKCIGSVVYVDTGNSFSSQRIRHFVSRISGPTFNQERDLTIQKVMSGILCHSVFDIFAMFDVLHQLQSSLRSQVDRADQNVRLLVVDSLSSLITPILGGGGSQGHALMTYTGFLLKKLANEHNLAVLVTNHMVGGDGGHLKPALGESWKSIPHVRLLLSRDLQSNICNISILKHSYLASGKAGRFTLDD
ncbi:DNA repair protein rad51d [Turnera subulata]|uniref:DNA repair protein rad51d n=1 Tax=Turnera subulata TaxID=218843 RepID=A0A9Q0JH10_9ROSI|nr:DNA repair protein rad51d [Turnera subulata]